MENMQKNNEEVSRYERKRLEREEKDYERRAALRKKKIRGYAIWGVILIVIISGTTLMFRSSKKHAEIVESALHSEKIADLGRTHADTVDVEAFNSTPPTSGTHFSSQTNWGIHKEPIPEGYQVHNLEHGGILIQYKPPHLLSAEEIEKCKASSSGSESSVNAKTSPSNTGVGVADDKCGGKPGIAQEVIDKLKAVGESYDWKKLILAPYPALAESNDKNIALTAWNYLDKFDDFDEQRIRAFIDAYRNHGPENVPDNMQSVTLP